MDIREWFIQVSTAAIKQQNKRLEREALALVNQLCEEGEAIGDAIKGVTIVYYQDGTPPHAELARNLPTDGD